MSETQNTQKDLLECFIEQFCEAKAKASQESNPLYILIDKVRYALNQVMPLDSHTMHTLDTLAQGIDEPMKVAVIGQFSSGKSTFLNSLLGQNILPSGITPITAKICHIAYGADYSLEITYKNGNVATKPLTFINEVSEADNTKIAFYKLYAPLALLKSINFLDTPGFNSLNQSDTDTTNKVLESVDGIIWLTLIDNVGKQSEKEIINSHIKRYANKSLCVLNQKDRLKGEQEVMDSLSYAKKAFSGLFEDVVAISAKNALLAASLPADEANTLRVDSNIESVLEFLKTHISKGATEAKRHTFYKQLRAIVLTYARLSLHAKIRFCLLEKCLIDSSANFTQEYPQSAFYKQFPTLFYTFESLLESLAQYIYNALEQTTRDFVRIDKKFGIKKEIKVTKDIVTLPRESLNLSLSNTDSNLARSFIKLGFDISASGEQFEELLTTHISNLRLNVEQWYDTFLPSLQNPLLQKALEELLGTYDNLVREHCENLKANLSFFAKILSLNYPLAINLCLNSISLRIQEAIDKHQKSPDTLPLFNPTLENIRDEINAGLHFGFLQEQLLTQPIHKKSLWHFEREEKALCQKQSANISAYKEQYANHFEHLKNLLQLLKRNLQD